MTRLISRLARDPEAAAAAKTRLLAANELFHDLDAETMSDVSEMTNVTTCRAGQLLFGPENRGEVLFFLKQGQVQIYKLNVEGKKLVLYDLKAGSFFGEMFLLGQGMADNYAEATEDSLICAMSRSDVYALLESRPAIARRVIDHLAERVNLAEAQLETLAHEGLDTRLAIALLRASDADDVVRGLSQQDLAERVGATRESVTRMLNLMAASGLVALARRKITILDREGVARRARPES